MSRGSTEERLIDLFKELGTNGSFTESEIAGYSAGINLVLADINGIFERLFLPADKTHNALEYKELIGQYIGTNPVAGNKVIAKRLANSLGCVEASEFTQAINNVCEELSYYISGSEFVFENFDYSNIGAFASLVRGYVPANMEPRIMPSNKSTFNMWDNWDVCWFQLDKYKFPFSLIDDLEVNRIE